MVISAKAATYILSGMWSQGPSLHFHSGVHSASNQTFRLKIRWGQYARHAKILNVTILKKNMYNQLVHFCSYIGAIGDYMRF